MRRNLTCRVTDFRAPFLAGALSLFLFPGCGAGPQGPTGPVGAQGPAGLPGDAGAPGVDLGTFTGLVQDADGGTLVGATVTTVPETQSVSSDSTGHFSLASIPIGSYDVTVSLTGFTPSSLAIGVAAGLTVERTVVLTRVGPVTAVIKGTVRGPPRRAPAPVAGASVCLAAGTTPLCATTAADGTYSISGVAPGPVFVTASAAGFAPGERRRAVFAVAGAAASNIDITLSGSPTAGATYIGSQQCVLCHTNLHQEALLSAWKASGHANFTDRSMAHMDITGWPAAPADCTKPTASNTNIPAMDPVGGQQRNVFLLRYKMGCSGHGALPFAMAFDSNQNGVFDAADTVMAVSGTIGGVATGAGQCSNTGGILPTGTPCVANFGSGPVAIGWWQQEYLADLSMGKKPSWVAWDTTGTPNDMLFLPLAWNQRGQAWTSAPDYQPDRAGTRSKKCAGCHDTGLTLAADGDGQVTTYAALEQSVGCEKCHGPGSAHAANADPKVIVDPGFITAKASSQMCGHCHSNDGTSASPQAFGYAWNDKAAIGGGEFIPGVHDLSDFVTLSAFGDASTYWPGLASAFPVTDHMTYQDFGASKHGDNPFQKLTCTDCHNSHGLKGGPDQFERTDEVSGDVFVFGANDLTLQNDVGCLGCHAANGSFAAVTIVDVANFHVGSGGTALRNGVSLAPGADEQSASTAQIATAVTAHMLARAGMPAFFDPTGALSGQPVGRCSSCHMAKTAATATYFPGSDARGHQGNAAGDVSSHSFKVAWPQASLATYDPLSTDFSSVMPNACGACHAEYRFGVAAGP